MSTMAIKKLKLYKTLEPCFITWAPFTINTSEPLTIARLSTMLLLLFSSSRGVSHGRIIFGLLQNSFGLSMLETTPELSGLAIGTSRKSPSGFQQSASRWTWLMNEAGSPAVAATLGASAICDHPQFSQSGNSSMESKH
ncbi:hypothetical protein HUJ05_012379 [Dendroctonus ponderosae]|nr:hypothetical protein HUJ05_012379 [Dendroctonus ponderosae]